MQVGDHHAHPELGELSEGPLTRSQVNEKIWIRSGRRGVLAPRFTYFLRRRLRVMSRIA